MHSSGESIARATCVLPRDAMQGRAIERERSIGEVVQAIDERVERRARAERLDRLGDALGVLDPHGLRVPATRVAVVSLVGRLTLIDGAAQPLQKAGGGGMYLSRAMTPTRAARTLPSCSNDGPLPRSRSLRCSASPRSSSSSASRSG